MQLGYKVSIFDNNIRGSLNKIKSIIDQIEFIKGDIRDFDDVKKATLNTDIIFHLAFINGTKFLRKT